MLASLAYLTALLACMARVSSSFASPLVTRENDSVGGYASNPQPPPLKFLYEMYAEVAPPLAIPNGPKGDRLVFPIVGGTFEGPIVKGAFVPAAAVLQVSPDQCHAAHLLQGRSSIWAPIGAWQWAQIDSIPTLATVSSRRMARTSTFRLEEPTSRTGQLIWLLSSRLAWTETTLG